MLPKKQIHVAFLFLLTHLQAWCWTWSPPELWSNPGACGQHRGWRSGGPRGSPGSWRSDLPLTSPHSRPLPVEICDRGGELCADLQCTLTSTHHVQPSTTLGFPTKHQVGRRAVIGWEEVRDLWLVESRGVRHCGSCGFYFICQQQGDPISTDMITFDILLKKRSSSIFLSEFQIYIYIMYKICTPLLNTYLFVFVKFFICTYCTLFK